MTWSTATPEWWKGVSGFSKSCRRISITSWKKRRNIYGRVDRRRRKRSRGTSDGERRHRGLARRGRPEGERRYRSHPAGISVIKDAILESRKIFVRLYTYSLYRISESLRLIITVAVLGLAVGAYPLTPLQLILLALLNDLPIISLATDKVKIANRPSKINIKKRFILSSSFGLVGVVNSLLLFFIARWMGLPWAAIQTIFFLKLTIGGHMLIYVAHTKERWWKFLPSKPVILATTLTQALATVLALTGLFMGGPNRGNGRSPSGSGRSSGCR